MLHINKHKLYAMRDSRKYPYQLAWVGLLDWNSEGMGGSAVSNSKCMGCFSFEIPDGEDCKSFA